MTLESPNERLEGLKAKHLALYYKHLPLFVLLGAVLQPTLTSEITLRSLILGALASAYGGLEARINTFRKEKSNLRL